MSRHLLLLPAPEAEWAELPSEEHEKGMRSHEQFQRDLREGGHRLVTAAPLTPSAEAVSLRPDGRGGVRGHRRPVHGVGRAGRRLLPHRDRRPGRPAAAVPRFAARGELIEFRDVVGPDDHDHGGEGTSS